MSLTCSLFIDILYSMSKESYVHTSLSVLLLCAPPNHTFQHIGLPNKYCMAIATQTKETMIHVMIKQCFNTKTDPSLKIHPAGDWLMSMDFRSAFFHIQIALHHRHFLRVCLRGHSKPVFSFSIRVALIPPITCFFLIVANIRHVTLPNNIYE